MTVFTSVVLGNQAVQHRGVGAEDPQTPRWVNIGMSAAPRRLDRGDVDLLHAHHRIKRALCFIAAGCQRLGQHARRDLPETPHLSLYQPRWLSWPPLPTMAFQ